MNDVNGYDSTIKYAIMDIVGAINKIESMKQDRYLTMHASKRLLRRRKNGRFHKAKKID